MVKPKVKGGAEKEREKKKRKLDEAGKDVKQKKVKGFFQSRALLSEELKLGIEVAVKQGNIAGPSQSGQSITCPSSSLEHMSRSCATPSDENESRKEVSPVVVVPVPILIESNQLHSADHSEEPSTTVTREVQPVSRSVSIFENDKELFGGSSLNDDQKRALLLQGPCQPKEFELQDGMFKLINKHRFKSTFYYISNQNARMPSVSSGPKSSSWLSYSPSGHYAYCHVCWLFADEKSKRSVWLTGFTDWGHIHTSAKKHSRSKSHLNNVLAATHFLAGKDISHELNKQLSDEAEKWRTVLNILFDTVKTLSSLGLAFRGHRENMRNEKFPGIYLSIIQLISRHNPTLLAHIQSPGRIKYLSKTITNEILDILGDQTRKAIINECKGAKFFTVLADSTTDVAHLDQLAVLVQYVVIKDSTVTIKESFLNFIRLSQGDAAYICKQITGLLFDTHDFEKKLMCGQGYDGAPVMSGKDGGVQAQMKQYLGGQQFVPYVHCPAHQLGLVLEHAAEKNASPSIKVFFSIIDAIFNYFSRSHKRWDKLIELSQDPSRLASASKKTGVLMLQELKGMMFAADEEEHEDTSADKNSFKERVLHVKGVSETRWSSRIKAVDATIQNFDCITDCLDYEGKRPGATGEDILKAKSLLSSLDWLFYLNLLWWHSILEKINEAEIILQKKEIDLLGAQNVISKVLVKIKALREESAYNKFVEIAKTNWQAMELENADYPVERIRRVKRMPGELARDTPLGPAENHRRGYFEAIDGMCGELQERASGFQGINQLFGFLRPVELKSMSSEDFEQSTVHIIKHYPDFFTSDLKYELRTFSEIFFSPNHPASDGPLEYLKFIAESNLIESFPELTTLLRIFLTLPISTASAERAMSALKYVKNYRRATLGDKNLNNYEILFFEKSFASDIDVESTIKIFAEKKARRGLKLE